MAFRAITSKSAIRAVARSFCAESHAAPKKLHGSTGKYAMAAYTAASKAGSLEKVEAELLAFQDVLSKNSAFADYLSDPTVPKPDKTKMVADILGDKKISSITCNLLTMMSANGRVGDAAKMANEFSNLMEVARGNVNAEVISAEPLTKKQASAVESAVMSLVGKGKKVELAFSVNPEILGGLQVNIGDNVMDLSVASRVTELNGSLEGAD